MWVHGLALVYAGAVSVFGPICAATILLVFIATRLKAELLTVSGVNIVEVFFVFASFGMFLLVAKLEGSALWLVLPGLFACIAFLSRETAAALVVFYRTSFLIHPPFRRWRYCAMAGGFCAVLGAEALYYAVVSGQPFIRFDIALGSVALVNPENPGTGNTLNHRWLGPVIALLVNNELDALFWFAIGTGVVLWRSGSFLSSWQGRVLLNVAALGTIWFLIVGFALDLRRTIRRPVVSNDDFVRQSGP